MALTATVYRWQVELSDVDRQVYEKLDLRLARHPSESMRYLLTRTVAYCLAYEEGIAFSKGGLSDADEPPVSIVDPTGVRTAWIDVGAPSAERLHRAAKATPRVAVFTHLDVETLRRETAKRPVHRAADILVWQIAPSWLQAMEPPLEADRNATFELVRTDGHLYATIGGRPVQGALTASSLVEPP
jgi:uncharacterized protein YaeQ